MVGVKLSAVSNCRGVKLSWTKRWTLLHWIIYTPHNREVSRQQTERSAKIGKKNVFFDRINGLAMIKEFFWPISGAKLTQKINSIIKNHKQRWHLVISGNIFFWDTGSHGSRGHVVFFFFIGNMGHRDTKLGHICDPGDFKNIGHNGTRVTGSRWSRWSRCVFFSRNAFSRVTGTRHTRRSHLALFCLIMSHICQL